MKAKIHAVAAICSFLFIATFWSSTVLSEVFLDALAVTKVKVAIPYLFIAFIPCMALTGATGFAMGGKSRHPIVIAKRRRMPVIALNGLLVLMPAALFLSGKAQAAEFDSAFYAVQSLELLAGLINLSLMALNIRDGRRISRRHP